MRPRIITVTPRQRAVIGELTYDGADNATIAARLGIGEQSVKTLLRRAMSRAGIHTRTALVVALLKGELRLRTENRAGVPRALWEDVA